MKITIKEKCLEILNDGGWHSEEDFSFTGKSFKNSLNELKRNGFNIQKDKINGNIKYCLFANKRVISAKTLVDMQNKRIAKENKNKQISLI